MVQGRFFGCRSARGRCIHYIGINWFAALLHEFVYEYTTTATVISSGGRCTAAVANSQVTFIYLGMKYASCAQVFVLCVYDFREPPSPTPMERNQTGERERERKKNFPRSYNKTREIAVLLLIVIFPFGRVKYYYHRRLSGCTFE